MIAPELGAARQPRGEGAIVVTAGLDRAWSRPHAVKGVAKREVGLFVTFLAFVTAAPATTLVSEPAQAGAAPPVAVAPQDPSSVCAPLVQGEMKHVFDTGSIEGGPYYVNDHTIVQAKDGSWHLFGIFHEEPMGDDTEVDFVHAVATERDPAKWEEGAFQPAPAASRIALRADPSIGETHLWAPHVVAADGRWLMIYQGGGRDPERASMRLAESDDLYRWSRASAQPLFEDICVARDPMLVRRDGIWSLYYTRCESAARKASGVAHRTSRDLVHWSEPTMVLSLGDGTAMPNSGYTESPFVFERGGYHYLSFTSYPIGWDATFVHRSRAPFAFPDAPLARLRAHAAEWVFDAKDRPYVTHAGPGQRGVWMSSVDLDGDGRRDTQPSDATASPL
jgi:hypothetical protein